MVTHGTELARIDSENVRHVFCFLAGPCPELIPQATRPGWSCESGSCYGCGSTAGFPGRSETPTSTFVISSLLIGEADASGAVRKTGAVGACAVRLAHLAGATVIATVQRASQSDVAKEAGAHHVVQSGGEIVEAVTSLAPGGVDHIVEVAFAANIGVDEQMLKLGGSIGAYASNAPEATIPFWPLVFKKRPCVLPRQRRLPARSQARGGE